MSLPRITLSIALALSLAGVSCSTTPSSSESPAQPKGGKLESKAQDIEEARDSDPDDFDTRMALGETYYELARQAIDDDKQQEYIDYLRKAQTEILAAARIEPTSPVPHTWLGIITAYQGDMQASETSFRNALRLAQRDQYNVYQGGTYYSNLAHISVYKGDLPAARRYLTKAAKTGAPQDEIDRISVLLAWKENDMVEARDIFNGAAVLSKDAFTATWDGAPLPKRMESFDDFAAVCCKNPTCGPHMENACKRERQAVSRRELAPEIVSEELALERERQEKLKEIYRKKKGGVEITIDDPNAPAAKTPAPSSTPAPAPAKKKD